MLFTLLFVLLVFLILTQSDTSLYYAFYGFSLWYSKMIPSLLPFMILSGIMIRMNFTESFAGIFHPILKRLLRCHQNISYGIMIGFLCGFPMGAKVCSELYHAGKITKNEAEYLLSFCNNIGPVYYCGFVIPLLGLECSPIYLFAMYGIPFFYGVLLRYTSFKNKIREVVCNKKQNEIQLSPSLLEETDKAISAGIQSILQLCGYMILFNLLNIIPHFVIPKFHIYIAPILEITGGLSMLQNNLIYYCLCLLHLGGLSCIAQTYNMIKTTPLSLKYYLLHKINQTLITILYFILIRICFS